MSWQLMKWHLFQPSSSSSVENSENTEKCKKLAGTLKQAADDTEIKVWLGSVSLMENAGKTCFPSLSLSTLFPAFPDNLRTYKVSKKSILFKIQSKPLTP